MVLKGKEGSLAADRWTASQRQLCHFGLLKAACRHSATSPPSPRH